MSHKFISIHGIDGTGKSTAVLSTVDAMRVNGIRSADYKSIDCDTQPFDTVVLEREHGPQARLYKSLGAKSIQGRRIAEAVAAGTTVVKDRWVIDVLADNSYRGATIPVGDLGIVQPDLSVILVCAERERQLRIQCRGNPTIEDLEPKTPGMRPHYFEEYLLNQVAAHSLNHTIVDTTRRNTHDVAAEIRGMATEI